MHDSQSRRRPVTYGKKATSRPLSSYSTFGIDDEASDTAQSSIESGGGRLVRSRLNKRIGGNGGTVKHTSLSCASRSASESESRVGEGQKKGTTNLLVFDINSSDDDQHNTGDVRNKTKKRKLTPICKEVANVETALTASRPVPQRLAQTQFNASSAAKLLSTSSGSEDSGRARHSARARPSSKIGKYDNKRVRRPEPGQDQRLVDNAIEGTPVKTSSSPTPPRTPKGQRPTHLRRRSSSPSAQLLRQLRQSMSPEQRTPLAMKRFDDPRSFQSSGSATPSQLALHALQLTPEKSPELMTNWEQQLATLETTGQNTPSRSRRRLIDALDSPRKQSKTFGERTHVLGYVLGYSDEESQKEDRKLALDPSTWSRSQESNTEPSENGSLDKARTQEHDALPAADTKITYAKQRSHLSDMVLDDLSVPTIQSTLGNGSQTGVAVISSFSSHKSPGTVEDDGDQTGATVKSIHELRRAGVNNRFRAEVELILEDVEASGPSMKATRLRGLMAIAKKLTELEFAKQFCEIGGHQRLAAQAQDDSDLLSSMLLCCTLTFLTIFSTPRGKSMRSIFDAVIISSGALLGEDREFSKIVKILSKDRQQSLSGATCKEVAEFEEVMLRREVWSDLDLPALTPQVFAMRSIEVAIRALRELKDFDSVLPLTTFEIIVDLVERMARADPGAESTMRDHRLQIAMSVLEYSSLSSVSLGPGYSEAAKRLEILSTFLSKTNNISLEHHDSIQQLVLRLTLSLTNNNIELSSTLGQTALAAAIFNVVYDQFLVMAVSADIDPVLHETRLASVILALGALINFAECSKDARTAIARIRTPTGSSIEWLTDTFDSRVATISDASSIEQTQPLVAVGYLSLLLCILCLNDQVRIAVRARLKGESLGPLYAAADEFLGHFRVVEESQVEDEISGKFSARFENVVSNLRRADTLS